MAEYILEVLNMQNFKNLKKYGGFEAKYKRKILSQQQLVNIAENDVLHMFEKMYKL